MGILSSVLSVGGTLIGGAVGGPVGAKIGGAIGGAVGGAVSSSKGSSKATEAQLAAIREARGIAGDAKTEAIGYQQPYMDFGRASTNALSGRLGLQTPQTAPTSGNALTMTGGAGKTGAQVPQVIPSQPIDMAPGPDGVYSVAPTPAASQPQAAPMPGAAPGVDPGTYGSTANPTAPAPYQAPDAPAAFNYRLEDALNSPVLQAALQRGVDVTQSAAAAQGRLFSGATLKALIEIALRTTYDFLNNERGFAYGVNRDQRTDYNTDRGFNYGQSRDARSDYQDTRDYLSGRFDTQTNNLFRGTAVGQGSAGVASGAATRYGDQVTGLVTDAGRARADNALTQGQIGSDLATGLGGLLASGLGGGSTAPKNALTMQSGGVNFVNTPASISRNISYFRG